MNELYNKNIEAIRKVNTELAKKIHVSADQKWIEMPIKIIILK